MSDTPDQLVIPVVTEHLSQLHATGLGIDPEALHALVLAAAQSAAEALRAQPNFDQMYGPCGGVRFEVFRTHREYARERKTLYFVRYAMRICDALREPTPAELAQAKRLARFRHFDSGECAHFGPMPEARREAAVGAALDASCAFETALERALAPYRKRAVAQRRAYPGLARRLARLFGLDPQGEPDLEAPVFACMAWSSGQEFDDPRARAHRAR